MKGIVVVLMVLTLHSARAQNWQEWTQQQKTQIQYLAQQIAGLKVYLDHAVKGYAIVQSGLSTIGNIKKGDLDLHNTFFASLKAVNPKIASSAKVAAALARGVQIAGEVRRTVMGLQASGQFTPEEVEEYKRGLKGLLVQCAETVEELVHLITSGHYEMRDDERLRRIDEAAKAMDVHYTFCVEQTSVLGRLARQRTAERVDIQFSKKLNGRQ